MLLIVGTEGAIGRKIAFLIANTKKIQPGLNCTPFVRHVI